MQLTSTLGTVTRRAHTGAMRLMEAAQFIFAVAKVWAGRASVWLMRAVRVTLAALKAVALQTMIVLERVLLSHSGRERVQAAAVFTLIFAFAVTSVDYLITGGPEFSMSASATPYSNQADLIAPHSRDAGIELAILETPAPSEPVQLAAADHPMEVVTHTVEAPVEAPKDEPMSAAGAERAKKPEQT